MALPAHSLKLIAPYLKSAKVLSLGYPDILARLEEIQHIFGYTPTRFSNHNEWHGIEHPLPDTLELFEQVGATLTVVDFTPERGMERIADLNYPHDLGKFDLVIDPGTLEHCFHIGQALMNAANAVKAGGKIFHLSPVSMINHGFYNLCPTLYFDFYTQNGWKVEEITLVPIVHLNGEVSGNIDPKVNFLLRALVTRKTEGQLMVPIQAKYVNKLQAAKLKAVA